MAKVTVDERFADHSKGLRRRFFKIDIAASGDTLPTGLRDIKSVEFFVPARSGVHGTATLVAGTVTVATTAVRTGADIFLTRNTTGGGLGQLSAPDASVIDATSFVINSSDNTDTSTVNWVVMNAAEVVGYTTARGADGTLTITFQTNGAIADMLVLVEGH